MTPPVRVHPGLPRPRDPGPVRLRESIRRVPRQTPFGRGVRPTVLPGLSELVSRYVTEEVLYKTASLSLPSPLLTPIPPVSVPLFPRPHLSPSSPFLSSSSIGPTLPSQPPLSPTLRELVTILFYLNISSSCLSLSDRDTSPRLPAYPVTTSIPLCLGVGRRIRCRRRVPGRGVSRTGPGPSRGLPTGRRGPRARVGRGPSHPGRGRPGADTQPGRSHDGVGPGGRRGHGHPSSSAASTWLRLQQPPGPPHSSDPRGPWDRGGGGASTTPSASGGEPPSRIRLPIPVTDDRAPWGDSRGRHRRPFPRRRDRPTPDGDRRAPAPLHRAVHLCPPTSRDTCARETSKRT